MGNNRPAFKRIFERMPTTQLDEMLQAELKELYPDDEAVRTILAVLREREKNFPQEVTAEMQDIWEEYPKNKPVRRVLSPGLRIAAVVCVVVLFGIIAVPYANADVAEYFTRWTDSVYQILVPGAIRNEKGCVFKTDHAGLQEIYDTAVSLGIERPMVPTWLPGETVLTECKVADVSGGTKVSAELKDNDYTVIITLSLFSTLKPHEYQKNDTDFVLYEVNGVSYILQQNKSFWTAFQVNPSYEFFISINSDKECLCNIIDSIYL